MKSVSTATQLSQDLVDESVELVKVHEGGAVELVMKYGDIYELTIQSIRVKFAPTATAKAQMGGWNRMRKRPPLSR